MTISKEKEIETKSDIKANTFVTALELVLFANHPEYSAITKLALIPLQPLLANVIAFAHKEKNKYSEREKINICKTISHIDGINESSSNLNNEWLAEYFDSIKNINDEQMQMLWGKILTQEINIPGSYSKRTLNIIRNISAAEARLFESIIPFVFNGVDFYYLPKCKSLKKYGINYYNIMLLREAGLLSYDDESALYSVIKPKNTQPIHNNKKAIILINNSNEEISIELTAMPLTQAANQLMKILEQEPNETFLEEFAKELLINCKKEMQVQLIDVLSVNDGIVDYDHKTCRNINID